MSPPFDMPIADSELVMGAYTEYTGLRFAFFLLAEYAGIVVMSALFATLYLGGWTGPFDHRVPVLWTLLKTLLVALVVIWIRVSWPRLREDQLQRVAWLGLLPLALGLGEGGEAQAPMARVVIGGLLSASLINLVFVPVVYSVFERGLSGAAAGEGWQFGTHDTAAAPAQALLWLAEALAR